MLNFFQDYTGKLSMMRLLSFIITLAVLPFVFFNPEHSSNAFLLLGAIVGAKAFQSSKE